MDSSFNVEELNKELSDVKSLNELLTREIEDYRIKVEKLTKELDKVKRDKEEPMSSSLTKNTYKISSTNNTQLQNEIDNLNAKVTRLQKENDSLKISFSTSISTPKQSTRDSIPNDSDIRSLRDENERLKYENESLLEQRNQLSKKADSLSKELEAKLKESKGSGMGLGSNQAMLDNLMKTNERLIQENANLMDQIRQLNDDMDNYRNTSRFDMDLDQHLKDRIRDLENELAMCNSEKDRLMVEVSRRVEKNTTTKKGLFDVM